MTDETTEVKESSPTLPTEPDWFLDDSTPGQGARPAWLPQKYKKVSDVAVAYGELEKKLGGFTGAPDNYDVASLELDENDFMLREITDVAKELNMSQEGFQKMVGRLISAKETQETAYLDDQVKALGPDGTRMLTEYKNWVRDYVPAAEQEVIAEWVKTADDLKVFNRIMANTHMQQVPTMTTMHMANNFESAADLRAELTKNIEKFDKDKTYRENWIARNARAIARNPDR